MIYEVWVNEDGTEISFFPSDHPQRELHIVDVDGQQMILRHQIETDTWEDAERQFNEWQGWPDYIAE